MIERLNELERFFENSLSQKSNDNLYDQLLVKFNLFYFDQDIYQKINIYQNKIKIIVIDEYLAIKNITKTETKYFIICFDHLIIAIEQSKISQIKPYFVQNNDSNIYFLSQNTENNINQSLKIPTLSFPNDNKTFFIRKQIPNFVSRFTENAIKVSNFRKVIYKVISGYLIQKSYSLNNFKRTLNHHKKWTNYSEKEIHDSNDYILLNTMYIGISVIDLMYSIRDERLVISKYSTTNQTNLIERERNNYLSIQHPFIPRYIGYLKVKNENHLLIEYIHGKSLSKIKELSLSMNDKLCIIFEIMLTIQYLHFNELVYRDLRPNNIIIDDNKTAVLIDFDRLIKCTQNNPILISTRDFSHVYIAPEIVTDKPYSFPADIYSLGMIICMIITEKDPKIIQYENNQTSLLDIPMNFKSMCEMCIQKDPYKRPSISKLIKHFFYIYILKMNKEIRTYFIDIMEYNINHGNKDLIDPQFAYNIGLLYFNGEMIQKDDQKAVKYLSLAADKNYLDAQVQLADIYYDSNSIMYDVYGAVFYYTIAAEKNVLKAQLILGKFYCNRSTEGFNIYHSILQHGSMTDIDKAIYYYSLAANQGNQEAQLQLGNIYNDERYNMKDINKAIHYYSFAADQNNSIAQNKLCRIGYDIMNLVHDVKKAIHIFTFLADKNHVISQFMLGYIYSNIQFGFLDVKKSIHYYELASKQNHCDSQLNLGIIYQNSLLIKPNAEKAIYYLELASKHNDSRAFYDLGVIYCEGILCPVNYEKAFYYFKRSADLNFPLAQYNVGIFYLNGRYVNKDIQKGLYYIELSAKQNELFSLLTLGKYYLTNNIEKSIYYYNLAAKQNSEEAFLNLGMIYHSGTQVPQDIHRAIYYYRHIPNNGFAAYLLGSIYFTGTEGFPRDFKKAIHYFTIASTNKIKEADHQLGYIYFNGIDVERDPVKGLKYYKLAANLNSVEAQHNLGVIYFLGQFVQQDYNKAIYYFSLAAKKKFGSSLYHLAMIFYHGYVPQNINKALYFYSLAAEENVPGAQFDLGTIYYEGKYVKKDIAKAIHYYKEASCYNNQFAKNNLGVIYKIGEGVIQNFSMSIEYFKEAIKQKNDDISRFNLAHLYFYNDFNIDIDTIIELLEPSLKLDIDICYFFFCLVIFSKIGKNSSSKEQIENEIKKYDKFHSSLSYKMYQYIVSSYLKNEKNYQFLYDTLKNCNIVYYKKKNYIRVRVHIGNDEDEERVNSICLPYINSEFYKGFGDIII